MKYLHTLRVQVGVRVRADKHGEDAHDAGHGGAARDNPAGDRGVLLVRLHQQRRQVMRALDALPCRVRGW